MYLSIKDAFMTEICSHFEPKLKMNERFSIIADLEMFNRKEDVYIHAQHAGNAPKAYQVYLDGVFISLFFEGQPPDESMLEFWKGFKQAYSQGKIRLTPPDYELEQQIAKEQKEAAQAEQKRIDALPEATPTQKMAKEVIRRVAKKKGKRAR